MLEASRERASVDSPEGQALLDAVTDAVQAYSDFLEREGIIWEDPAADDGLPRLKASALVFMVDYGTIEGGVKVTLQNGALDRVFGNGKNPCPFGLGPADIPHKPRDED
jgi:hypothetical protein